MIKIYKITNKVNKKFYIGYTSKSLEERFDRHLYNAFNLNIKTHLYNAMRKNGKDNFYIELIREGESKLLEVDTISKLKPLYNMTKGNDGGDTSKSINFIKSMKKYHKNKTRESYATYGMLGKKQTDKAKADVSKKQKEIWKSMSKKDRKHRGEKVKGKRNGMYGKTPPNAISILYMNNRYKSINEASKKTGKSIYHIMKEVNNGTKKRLSLD
jgi:group I intron endonuclease